MCPAVTRGADGTVRITFFFFLFPLKNYAFSFLVKARAHNLFFLVAPRCHLTHSHTHADKTSAWLTLNSLSTLGGEKNYRIYNKRQKISILYFTLPPPDYTNQMKKIVNPKLNYHLVQSIYHLCIYVCVESREIISGKRKIITIRLIMYINSYKWGKG